MEPLKTDSIKLPNMIMCGDHPSLTKTELNLKEVKITEGKEKDNKIPANYTRISPSSSRTEAREGREPPRRAGSAPRPDCSTELLRAAIGSFRWPPYLVLTWLLVLAAAHALHALAATLATSLPAVRKLCKYFRTQTAQSWQNESELAQRLRPMLLACVTALMYALLGVVAVTHAIVKWAVEPLAADVDDRPSGLITKVTDYVDFAKNENVKK